MTCRECTERLLEVDPRILEAVLSDRDCIDARSEDVAGDDVLGDHLRKCASCRAVAERVLEAHRRLAAELAALEPGLPPEEALAAAVRESHRRRRRTRAASWAAVAAVMSGVLAIRALDVSVGSDTGPAVVASRAGTPAMPEVEALLDESVVVLETDNEDVVVFWFYQGRGE